MNLIQLHTDQRAYEEITHSQREHHGIGDGEGLVMMKIEDPPLRSPKRTPDLASRWRTGGDDGSISWITIILSPWFFLENRYLWSWTQGLRGHRVGTTHLGALGGGAPWWVVPTQVPPSGGSWLQKLSLFVLKFLTKFCSIPRTFISAQKQYHGSSAENSVTLWLVSFKSCKLESKTRGKALAKVGTLEKYQLPQA